jgi:hypothetical protein
VWVVPARRLCRIGVFAPELRGVSRDQARLVCPHCQAQLDVRVEVKAAVVSPLQLHFDNTAAFEQWLRASGLTLDEFETLPVYEWYREELEPFVRASRETRIGPVPQPRDAPPHPQEVVAAAS